MKNIYAVGRVAGGYVVNVFEQNGESEKVITYGMLLRSEQLERYKQDKNYKVIMSWERTNAENTR